MCVNTKFVVIFERALKTEFFRFHFLVWKLMGMGIDLTLGWVLNQGDFHCTSGRKDAPRLKWKSVPVYLHMDTNDTNAMHGAWGLNNKPHGSLYDPQFCPNFLVCFLLLPQVEEEFVQIWEKC